MREIEAKGIKYESSMEYVLDWCDGIRAATGAPGCYVSEEELWLESGISQLNAHKNHYRKVYNKLKQKVKELEAKTDEEEEKDWKKEAGEWQKLAGYWKERYLERDEYSEKLEEKLDKINETIIQEPDRGCMDKVIGSMKECVNCNSKVPAEFARCPKCNKSTTEVDLTRDPIIDLLEEADCDE